MRYFLANKILSLVVDSMGARIVHCAELLTKKNILQSCLDKEELSYTPDECGGFALLPIANRVANDTYTMAVGDDTRKVELAKTSIDGSEYVHGFAWLKEWSLISNDVDSLGNPTLVLGFKDEGTIEEGYHYEAQLMYKLVDAKLEVKLTIKHLGKEPRLYGVGFHPYFEFDCAQDKLMLSTTAFMPQSQHYLTRAAQPLRCAYPASAPMDMAHHALESGAWDFDNFKEVPDVFVNHAYTGFNGARVRRHDLPYQDILLTSGVGNL